MMSARIDSRKQHHATAPLEDPKLRTLSYAAGRLVPAAVGAILIPIVARALGPAGYGAYCVLAAEALFLVALLGSWADLGTIRFYAKVARDGRTDEYRHAIVRGLLLCYAAFALIAAGLTIATGSDVTTPLVAAGVAAVATLVNLRGTFFRALHAGRDFSVLLSVSSILRLGITAAVLVAWPTPAGVAVAWMLSGLAALSFVRGRRAKPPTASQGTYKLGPLLRYSAPLTLVGVGAVGLFLADRLIIAEMLGERAVGVYSLSYAIADQTIVVVSSIMLLPVFPQAVDVFDARGREAAGAAIISALRRWSLIVFPLAGAIGVASREIVLLVGGSEYVGTVVLIPLVLAGSLAYALGQFLSIPLQLLGRTALYAGIICGAFALNVVANVLWIPWWGISGAAAATFAAYAIFAIGSGYFSRGIVPLRLAGAIVAPAFVASGIPVVICSFTPNRIVHAAGLVLLAAIAAVGLARARSRSVCGSRRFEAR
jgi:O-antigen/teichoic acid export membrane protein